MNSYKPSLCKRLILPIMLATIALPTISNAERFNFRVVFTEGSGSDQIRAGNADAAIEILENRTRDADQPYLADELSTLCALYIVQRRLITARKACQTAVETDQSDAAYNNRGVLRAHIGDTDGAIEDFERARILPKNDQQYIDGLKSNDVRLVAGSNYSLALKFSVKRAQFGQSLAGLVRGARVEELGN